MATRLCQRNSNIQSRRLFARDVFLTTYFYDLKWDKAPPTDACVVQQKTAMSAITLWFGFIAQSINTIISRQFDVQWPPQSAIFTVELPVVQGSCRDSIPAWGYTKKASKKKDKRQVTKSDLLASKKEKKHQKGMQLLWRPWGRLEGISYESGGF